MILAMRLAPTRWSNKFAAMHESPLVLALGRHLRQCSNPRQVSGGKMLWGERRWHRVHRQIIKQAMAPSAPIATQPMEPIDAQAEEAEAAQRPEPFPYTVRS